MNELNFEKLLIELCRAEKETRLQLTQCLKEINQRKLWKTRGRKSFQEYCQLDLGYSLKEVRGLLIQMGLVLPSDHLVSDHPEVQKRIESLKAWRRNKSVTFGLPAYRFLTNRTVLELAEKSPTTASELSDVHGMGQKKVADYGDEILSILNPQKELSWMGTNPVNSFDQSGSLNGLC